MAMDATLQIGINGEIKRNLGISFAEAVRIFAQQSLREGGMPFRPTMKTWDEMTAQEISANLPRSEEDIAQGKVFTQADLDRKMKKRFAHGNTAALRNLLYSAEKHHSCAYIRAVCRMDLPAHMEG